MGKRKSDDNPTADQQPRRAPNWTKAEINTLVNAVEPVYDSLVALGSSPVAEDQKKAIWATITSKINAVSSVNRTSKAVRDKMVDLKSKTKQKIVQVLLENGNIGDYTLDISELSITVIQEKIAGLCQFEQKLGKMIGRNCLLGIEDEDSSSEQLNVAIPNTIIDEDSMGLQQRRAPNWTRDELNSLVNAVHPMYETLYGKHSLSVSEDHKRVLWATVTTKVNAVSSFNRTYKAVRDKMADMKSKTKKKVIQILLEKGKTEDLSELSMTEIEEMIEELEQSEQALIKMIGKDGVLAGIENEYLYSSPTQLTTTIPNTIGEGDKSRGPQETVHVLENQQEALLKESRRAPNWTKTEINTLVKTVHQVYESLYGKHSSSLTEDRKQVIWDTYNHESKFKVVNSVSSCIRTCKAVRDKMVDLKSKTKKKIVQVLHEKNKTGEGPLDISELSMTAIEEKIVGLNHFEHTLAKMIGRNVLLGIESECLDVSFTQFTEIPNTIDEDEDSEGQHHPVNVEDEEFRALNTNLTPGTYGTLPNECAILNMRSSHCTFCGHLIEIGSNSALTRELVEPICELLKLDPVNWSLEFLNSIVCCQCYTMATEARDLKLLLSYVQKQVADITKRIENTILEDKAVGTDSNNGTNLGGRSTTRNGLITTSVTNHVRTKLVSALKCSPQAGETEKPPGIQVCAFDLFRDGAAIENDGFEVDDGDDEDDVLNESTVVDKNNVPHRIRLPDVLESFYTVTTSNGIWLLKNLKPELLRIDDNPSIPEVHSDHNVEKDRTNLISEHTNLTRNKAKVASRTRSEIFNRLQRKKLRLKSIKSMEVTRSQNSRKILKLEQTKKKSTQETSPIQLAFVNNNNSPQILTNPSEHMHMRRKIRKTKQYRFKPRNVPVKRRVLRRKVIPNYSCPEIDCHVEKFYSPIKLERHIRRNHGGAFRFHCDVNSCRIGFFTEIGLAEHRSRRHDPSRILQCKHCPTKFTTKENLSSHYKYFHSEPDGTNRFICETCGKEFYMKRSLRDHQIKMHGGEEDPEKRSENSQSCHICGFILSNLSSLNLHIERKHPEAVAFGGSHLNYVCQRINCTFKTSSASALKIHDFVHSTAKNFQCHVCPTSFKYAQRLRHHLKLVHNGIREQCPQCPNTFASPNALKQHISVIHDPKPRFKCEDCGEGFPINKYFVRHRLICAQGYSGMAKKIHPHTLSS